MKDNIYPFAYGSARMPQTDLKSLKVLIVEDDTPSRLCLTLTLEDKVGQVFEADNGKSGLELYHRHSPDVIITDLRMPCMDGFEVCRPLKADVRTRGARKVWLDVRPSNEAALRLYQGAGYRSTGRRPRYYHDGEDALLLERTL